MDLEKQLEGLSAKELAALTKAARLIKKEPGRPWTARDIAEAFDHQRGSPAIDRVLSKVAQHRATMGKPKNV